MNLITRDLDETDKKLQGGLCMYFSPYAYMTYPFYHTNQTVYQLHPVQVQNSFPPVNTEKLHVSAERFQLLIQDARLLTDKIVSDATFASDLMNAAQLSDQETVDKLIQSTGITIKTKTYYSPTGIQVEFDSTEIGESCCKLDMRLMW